VCNQAGEVPAALHRQALTTLLRAIFAFPSPPQSNMLAIAEEDSSVVCTLESTMKMTYFIK
jgi:hypothetical protein